MNNSSNEYFKEGYNEKVVLIIDELGLAEISEFNPLKVLHVKFMFKYNLNCKQGYLDDYKKNGIGFVGISNWALDAAKNNRAVYIARSELDKEETLKTTKDIAEAIIGEKRSKNFVDLWEKIASALIKFYNKFSKKKEKPIHGIFYTTNKFFQQISKGSRDYYCLIKSIAFEIKENNIKDLGDERIAQIIQLKVMRNFSGSKGSWQLFYKYINYDSYKLNSMLNVEDILIDFIDTSPPLRYLMLIGENDVYNTYKEVLRSALLKQKRGNNDSYDNDTICFLGPSSAGKDLSFKQMQEQIKTDLNKIINILPYKSTLGEEDKEKKKKKIVVLEKYPEIYSSLYELLNMKRKYAFKKLFCEIAHAKKVRQCEIHLDFKIVVVLTPDELKKENSPFLNRFEKQEISVKFLIPSEYEPLFDEVLKYFGRVTYQKNPPCMPAFRLMWQFDEITIAEFFVYLIQRGVSTSEIVEKCKKKICKFMSFELMVYIRTIKNDLKEDYDFYETQFKNIYKGSQKFVLDTVFDKIVNWEEKKKKSSDSPENGIRCVCFTFTSNDNEISNSEWVNQSYTGTTHNKISGARTFTKNNKKINLVIYEEEHIINAEIIDTNFKDQNWLVIVKLKKKNSFEGLKGKISPRNGWKFMFLDFEINEKLHQNQYLFEILNIDSGKELIKSLKIKTNFIQGILESKTPEINLKFSNSNGANQNGLTDLEGKREEIKKLFNFLHYDSASTIADDIFEKLFNTESNKNAFLRNDWKTAYLQSNGTYAGCSFWNFLQSEVNGLQFNQKLIKSIVSGFLYYGFPQVINARYNEKNFKIEDITKLYESIKTKIFNFNVNQTKQIQIDYNVSLPYVFPKLKKLFQKAGKKVNEIDEEARGYFSQSSPKTPDIPQILERFRLQKLATILNANGEIQIKEKEILNNLDFIAENIKNKEDLKIILQEESLNPFAYHGSKAEQYFLFLLFINNIYLEYFSFINYFKPVSLENSMRGIFQFEEGYNLHVLGKMIYILKPENLKEKPIFIKHFDTLKNHIALYLDSELNEKIKNKNYWTIIDLLQMIFPDVEKKKDCESFQGFIKEIMINNLDEPYIDNLIGEKLFPILSNLKIDVIIARQIYLWLFKFAQKITKLPHENSSKSKSQIENAILNNIKILSSQKDSKINCFSFTYIFYYLLNHYKNELFELNFISPILISIDKYLEKKDAFSNDLEEVIDCVLEDIISFNDVNDDLRIQHCFEYYENKFMKTKEDNLKAKKNLLGKRVAICCINKFLNIVCQPETYKNDQNFADKLALIPKNCQKQRNFCEKLVLNKLLNTCSYFQEMPSIIKEKLQQNNINFNDQCYLVNISNDENFLKIKSNLKILLESNSDQGASLTQMANSSINTNNLFYLFINLLNLFLNDSGSSYPTNLVINQQSKVHKSLMNFVNSFASIANGGRSIANFKNLFSTSALAFLSIQCGANTKGLNSIFTNETKYNDKKDITKKLIPGSFHPKNVLQLNILSFPDFEWRNYEDDTWELRGTIYLYLLCDCGTPHALYKCNFPHKPYNKCECGKDISPDFVAKYKKNNPLEEVPKIVREDHYTYQGLSLPDISQANLQKFSGIENSAYRLLHFIILSFVYHGISSQSNNFLDNEMFDQVKNLERKDIWTRIENYYHKIKEDFGNEDNFDLWLWGFLIEFYKFNNSFDSKKKNFKVEYEKNFGELLKKYSEVKPAEKIQSLVKVFAQDHNKMLAISEETSDEKASAFYQLIKKNLRSDAPKNTITMQNSDSIISHIKSSCVNTMIKSIALAKYSSNFDKLWKIIDFYQYVTGKEMNGKLTRKSAQEKTVKDFEDNKNPVFLKKFNEFMKIANENFTDELTIGGSGEANGQCAETVEKITYSYDMKMYELLPQHHKKCGNKKKAGWRTVAILKVMLDLHNDFINKYNKEFERESNEILHKNWNVPISVQNITITDLMEWDPNKNDQFANYPSFYVEKKESSASLKQTLDIQEIDKDFRKKIFKNKKKFETNIRDTARFPVYEYLEDILSNSLQFYSKFEKVKKDYIPEDVCKRIRKELKNENLDTIQTLYSNLVIGAHWIATIDHLSVVKLSSIIKSLESKDSCMKKSCISNPYFEDLKCSQILMTIYEVECALCEKMYKNPDEISKKYYEKITNQQAIKNALNNDFLRETLRYMLAILLSRMFLLDVDTKKEYLEYQLRYTIDGYCVEEFFKCFDLKRYNKILNNGNGTNQNQFEIITAIIDEIIKSLESLTFIQVNQALSLFEILNEMN